VQRRVKGLANDYLRTPDLRGYLTIKDPLNIPVNSFPRNKKRLCCQSFTVKGKFQLYEVMKDIGSCALSLLVAFVAFSANILARIEPLQYCIQQLG